MRDEPAELHNGLTPSQVKQRREKYGRNIIEEKQKRTWVSLLAAQFTSPLILVLFIAAFVSLAIGIRTQDRTDLIDGILIFAIVLFSGIAGFVQNWKAEKAIKSIQKIATPRVRVRREGKEVEIPSTDLVPDDILILSAGDIVPADAVLLSASHLTCDESLLTGESQSVAKQEHDPLFKATAVQTGRGVAKVTAIGMRTKVGDIARTLEEIEKDQTPFQREIAHLSKIVLLFVGGLIAIIFLAGLSKFSFLESFTVAISLAVAAIPEGLPAVLTVVLAMGARTMMQKKTLVRKLSAVESMGSIEVICTDKTGTLTKNQMSVVSIFSGEKEISAPFLQAKKEKQIVLCGALCNDAYLRDGKYIGDPTETALKELADKIFPQKKDAYEREDEIPFTSERKMMSVLCKEKETGKRILFAKGAPEVILNLCSYERVGEGNIVRLTQERVREIQNQYKQYAQKSFRVLACAQKEYNKKEGYSEKNLVFLGLVALMDPPREEVAQAIQDSYRAGIRVIMLTGDYAETAKAVARHIGLKSDGVISGQELETTSEEHIIRRLEEGVNIFVRISPFHKLKILKILKKQYHSVAMTGDGVNDTLALKQADVGIAMGIRGTETAKAASDIILLDDNFSTIRAAIREGRRLLDNMKKFINYLAVSNTAEVGVLFIATIFLSLPEPILLPVQILWINLITDGFPAIALSADPARPDVMRRPPRGGKPLLDSRLRWTIGIIGLKKTAILLITFLLVLPRGFPEARTALFTGFILYEFVRIAVIRFFDGLPWYTNPWLLSALGFSLALQLAILYSPIRNIFQVTPLGGYAWGILIAGTIVGFFTAIFLSRILERFLRE